HIIYAVEDALRKGEAGGVPVEAVPALAVLKAHALQRQRGRGGLLADFTPGQAPGGARLRPAAPGVVIRLPVQMPGEHGLLGEAKARCVTAFAEVYLARQCVSARRRPQVYAAGHEHAQGEYENQREGQTAASHDSILLLVNR